MKHIKLYEEFSYHDVLPWAYYGIGLIVSKYVSKYLLGRKNKEFYKEVIGKMPGKWRSKVDYASGRWVIEEKDGIVSVIKKQVMRPDKLWFTIDKNKRIFTYISDIRSVTVKLSKSEMNSLVSDLNYTKEVSETIEDCFYDLSDEGLDNC
jgi:hypothetical protein